MHNYLGITFDFSTYGKVEVSMDDYIAKVLEGFPEEIFGTVLTPVAEHLSKVSDENKEKVLPEGQGSIFHLVVAQLLSAAFQVCHDL